MKLDPKALEAACKAYGPMEAAIQAYLNTADLVPRTHKRPTAALQNALDERDEARRKLAYFIDLHSKEHSELQLSYEEALLERDEARAERRVTDEDFPM